jgi:hypothetical protein
LIDYTEILLVPTFSGQTDTAETALKFRSGYWVYTSEFGGNLVDELTVREFLDNPNHEKLATDFFNYLKENFTKDEFNELYYNNIRLSIVLNDYYNKTVRQNVLPSKTVGLSQLTATTAVTYTENYFYGHDPSEANNVTFVGSTPTVIPNAGNLLNNLYTGSLSDVGGVLVGATSPTIIPTNETAEFAVSKSPAKIGERNNKEITALVTINTGDSYYLSFSLYKNNNILEDANYTTYRKDVLNGSTIKQTTEWFRYALRKNGTQINPNGNVVNEYSFSKFNPSTPLLPNQSQLRIQFKVDRAILDTNNRTTSIPVEIVYDRPSTLTNQFFVVDFGYINASAGIDFAFSEGGNNSLLTQSINILSGSTGTSVTFVVKNPDLFNRTDCEITLVLKDQGTIDPKLLSSQQYSVSQDTFRVLSNQDNEITVLDDTSVDKIETKSKVVTQMLLQSFVDPNYNDNESEIWYNPPTNITLISNGTNLGSNLTLPLTDLTIYKLYTVLVNLGYETTSRAGNGGVVVVMNGNTDNVRVKLKTAFPGLAGLAKRTAYGILGYNLISIDLSNSFESEQILSKLQAFWSPLSITD